MKHRRITVGAAILFLSIELLYTINYGNDFYLSNMMFFYFVSVFIAVLYVFPAYKSKSSRTLICDGHTSSYFTTLFDQNPSLIFQIDFKGKITSVNQTSLDILNYSKSDLLSKSFLSFFNTPDDQHYIKGIFHVVKEGKVNTTFLAKISKKDQSDITMEFTVIPHVTGQKSLESFFVVGNDISELLKHKERIVKTQIELKETIQKQQGMIFKYLKKGNSFIHTLCDGELLYKFGLSPKDVIGKDLYEFMPNDQIDSKLKSYEAAWNGDVVVYEGLINGIHYLTTLSPVYREGKVREVIGSSIDITVRKHMEDKLRKNENLYRTVLHTMSEGIFIIDENGINTNLNKNVEKHLGIKSGQFGKSTAREMGIEFVSEDGTSMKYDELPGVNTVNDHIERKDVIIGIKEKGSLKKWFSVNSKPLNLSESVKGSLVSFHDISLQKIQELKLKETHSLNQNLIDNLRTAIFVTDENRSTLLVNKAVRKMLNIQSEGSAIGESARKFHCDFTENKSFSDEIQGIINAGLPNSTLVKSDRGHVYRLNYIPVLLEGKNKVNLWTFEDFTEISELQMQTQNAKEEAETANMAKSDFLSKMSHELRTPLNGILGFAQLLGLDKELNAKQQKFISEIQTSGGHLLSLINEVLDLSRIETGSLKVSIELVNIKDIINECIGMVTPLAEKRKIKIAELLNNLDHCFVKADPIRLRQVLLNLLDNAIKYNHENGEIHIYGEKGMNDITIFLKDTGIGINSDKLTAIFEPFYRIKNNTSIEGTGIGLSLTKQLVEVMYGEIGVSSTAGHGSIFWFSLPIQQEPELADPELGHNEESFIQKRAKNISTILYIEDNPSNITLVEEIMESQPHYSLIYAKEGAEGLTKAKNERVDLILLDINLPDMNGYQVFDELKRNQHTKNIPVIAISANAISMHIEDSLNKGFQDYLTKPINIKDLLFKVKKFI
ncbi:PAS domain S-box protein [Bacillus sp. MUM 13]|uniref:PAS domain-containing hybrid sensor histidine kinase/response regulator n=1 Tax=Bacillus sp. MUM 13 TaxID=1678001 RepID=UPI0009F2FF7C|nr:PAS domain S-box protein [Bacillus sp. MUM 13]